MSEKSFYIKTFGCQMNERDSEIMAQALAMHGYVEGMELADVDLVILNTCSIRAKAEQKVMSLLGSLRKAKLARPTMQICVAGCVAQQEGELLLEKMAHVDLVIGTQNIYRIGELLESARAQQHGLVATSLEDRYDIPRMMPQPGSDHGLRQPKGHQPFRKFVTIMQGCNNYCAYCVVPYTRGRENSRNVRDIIDEVTMLVEGGVKEITLLGQNVNSYGKTNTVTENTQPCTFADLLHQVAAIPGLSRLRFTTSNPKDLSEELMRCFKEIPNLCPQFHLPVQAGSDAVLRRMNRKYSVARYLDLVDRLRGYCPEIALTTDIIVGFPGETDADFQETMDLLERVRYHGSFSFKYSDRPGTLASGFTGKVNEEVKSARLARFQARQDEISLEQNLLYLNKTCELLIEEVHADGAMKGRTVTNHIVHLREQSPGSLSPGDFVLATITHAGQHSLQGKMVR